MIHNFESWFKSKTGVNEQMVIKVKSGGSTKSGASSSKGGSADSGSTTKTPKMSVDVAKVSSFFDSLPGMVKKDTDPWGPNSVACIFPHSGKNYQIFVWSNGFAIRNTENWRFDNYGTDAKRLKLSLSDYQNWKGSYKTPANITVEFSGWDDFRNKVFGQQGNAAAGGYGTDDPTRADQLVEEIVNDIDNILKDDGFKKQFKGTVNDEEDKAIDYLKNKWWPTYEAPKMNALKSEIDKLPPQNQGGKGNRERLQATYDKIKGEIDFLDRGGDLGNKIKYADNEYLLSYNGPNGPVTRTFYTDI